MDGDRNNRDPAAVASELLPNLRVLMVTTPLPTPSRPGTMAPVARQIASIRALGVDVDVLEIDGIRRIKYLQTVRPLRARAGEADIVHAHYGYAGWIARLQRRAPLVVSFMGDDLLGTPDANGRLSPFSKLVVSADRRLARIVDAVIVKSPEMARVVAPAPARVIPNGVDLDVFHPVDPQQAKDELGWRTNARYVLFAGDPRNPRKGFPLAREAVAVASRRVEQQLELVPLAGVEADRVPVYMNASDALIMTSFLEGSPNVVKEAMACNLPVVSVPVGDVGELLADVDQCVLCERDADELGQALADLFTNGRRSDGREALIRKRLDLESVARRIADVYADVLRAQAS